MRLSRPNSSTPIKSPWGGDWGQASIGRYLKRAKSVSPLKALPEAAR